MSDLYYRVRDWQLHSLLVIHVFHLYRVLPSVDRKCKKDLKCWYCSTRCENCFGIAGFDSEGFCSVECMSTCRGSQMNDIHIVVAGPDEPPFHLIKNRCAPMVDTHTKLFHVYIEGLSYDGLPYKGEIAVCHGNGLDGYPDDCLYAVYFCRTSSKWSFSYWTPLLPTSLFHIPNQMILLWLLLQC